MKQRCGWCSDDPLYIEYHDHEWGVPAHDDRHLFEMLILEGAQAGLSWITILKKRENYRQAFNQFDAVKVAAYTDTDVERLVNDAGIVRNRLKIKAAIKNAQGVLQLQQEFGSLDRYLWSFVEDQPIQNCWENLKAVPVQTDVSVRMSKDMKKRGFSFVGPTICYAFMQAVGMVNDHEQGCFRHQQVRDLSSV